MHVPLLGPMWDYFKASAWDAALNLTEMATLGRHRWYWRLHAAAARAYFRDPAIRVIRREAESTGLSGNQLVYGETPALSLLGMLARVGVGASDTVFDLGCGRGLALLAATLEFHIRGVGIDAIPTFVERGQQIAMRLGIADRARFILGDFREQDLSGATIFYAAATTFERDILDDLAALAAEQAGGDRPIRFITLSQTLLPPWKLVDKASYPMTWGWNSVYFHVLESSAMSRSSSSA